MTTVNPLLVGSTANHAAADARKPRTAAYTSIVSDPTPYRGQLWSALTQRRQPTPSLARGLPLAGLSMPDHASTTYYAITAMEVRGRLADQSPVHILHWQPGLRVDIAPMPGLMVIRPTVDGSDAIARQGHVRLPARIRHACHLDDGDRLLMAALLIYTMTALDAMILDHATAVQAAA